MNNTDPIFKALDRLAHVADTNPVGDPMPGIVRKARANRRRATALAASGLAVVVAAGVGAVSLVDLTGTAGRHGYANLPITSPSPDPSTPTPPPDDPALARYDHAQADVDGDGAADTVSVLIPEADADEGMDVSTDVRLHLELAAGGTVELRLRDPLIPTIAGTPDLDRNGTDEVVLGFSGGDAGWLKVFTWDGDTLVQAEAIAPDSMEDLVFEGGLYSEAGLTSSTLADDDLISWVPIGDESAPFEVRVWTWHFDGTLLVATEAEERQCFRPDQRYPEPC